MFSQPEIATYVIVLSLDRLREHSQEVLLVLVDNLHQLRVRATQLLRDKRRHGGKVAFSPRPQVLPSNTYIQRDGNKRHINAHTLLYLLHPKHLYGIPSSANQSLAALYCSRLTTAPEAAARATAGPAPQRLVT